MLAALIGDSSIEISHAPKPTTERSGPFPPRTFDRMSPSSSPINEQDAR